MFNLNMFNRNGFIILFKVVFYSFIVVSIILYCKMGRVILSINYEKEIFFFIKGCLKSVFFIVRILV